MRIKISQLDCPIMTGILNVPDTARAVASKAPAHSCRSSLRLANHKADPIRRHSETKRASWFRDRKAGRSSRGGALLGDDATLMVTPGIRKTGVRSISSYEQRALQFVSKKGEQSEGYGMRRTNQLLLISWYVK